MTRYTKHKRRSKFDGTEQQRRIRMGKLLCDAREAAGFTQAVVATTLGYLHQYDISQIENGKRTLEAIELETLSRLYGKPLNDFATWRDDQPTTEELRRRACAISEKQSAARDSRRGRKPKMTAKEKEQRKQHFDALARRLFEAQAIKKSGEKSEP